jgi:hypothetical protein
LKFVGKVSQKKTKGIVGKLSSEVPWLG